MTEVLRTFGLPLTNEEGPFLEALTAIVALPDGFGGDSYWLRFDVLV